MRAILATMTLVGFTLSAAAQTPPPAPAPASPPPGAAAPASPPPPSALPAPSVPPVDCRAQAQSKGLRGEELRDSVAVCVQEQRLACIKDAVAKKVVGKERHEFMQTCAGRPNRPAKKQDRL